MKFLTNWCKKIANKYNKKSEHKISYTFYADGKTFGELEKIIIQYLYETGVIPTDFNVKSGIFKWSNTTKGEGIEVVLDVEREDSPPPPPPPPKDDKTILIVDEPTKDIKPTSSSNSK